MCLEPPQIGSFSSFEIAEALRDTSWDDVATSGDYKGCRVNEILKLLKTFIPQDQ